MLNTLDLFAGIGGFSLGLERTGGFRTAAFCEIDPAARRVLNKNFPGVPIYEDVSVLTKERLDADGISIDVITGGFPCQDISTLGGGEGLAGARSGLWFQFHRLIDEIRPDLAVIENVSALRTRGLEQVLRSLAAIGYDAEWHDIPAAAVGAPHGRGRVWIAAYPEGSGLEGLGGPGEGSEARTPRPYLAETYRSNAWDRPFADFVRVDDGLPGRVDRLKQHGNAVVPQIPELIGNAFLRAA